jgi:hypothetical protein
MDKHVTILGILYIALGVLGILAAIIVFLAIAGGGLISGDEEAIVITSIVGSAIALFLVVISVPGIIGGVGLLKKQSWARILVLILGILNLLNIPFGTVLGIYTLWALLKPEAEEVFRKQTQA